MKEVVCKRCGTVDNYYTEQAGPHVKAICMGCDNYIMFLPQGNNVKFTKKEIYDTVFAKFGKETADKISDLFSNN